MKIKYLTLCLAFAVAGCTSRVDLVQDATLNGYPDTTIGEALDNYNGCKSGTSEWEEFETDNGRKFVRFTCTMKDVKPFVDFVVKDELEKATKRGKNLDARFNVENIEYVFDFAIAKDEKSFRIERSGLKYTWEDGKSAFDPNSSLYKSFYQGGNGLYADIQDQINGLPSEGLKEYTTKAIRFPLVLLWQDLYMKAK